ncbi:putative RNase BN, tRNA processing enzyme [Chlamydiales bacterium STE3]|nr:putative RNase BN, tRNA processing enzyme [Chlamydiales bacterium STE3]
MNKVINANSMIRNFFYRFFSSLRAAGAGFISDNCYGKASALSYYTLLAIVPVLAVAFGVAKGFGFEKILEEQLRENFYQQPDFAQKMIDFANSTLDHAHGSLIAGIGVITLFWTSFGLLGNLENVLNEIWKIGAMRPWERRIPDYLAVLILTPIIFVASSSLTIFIVAKVVKYTSDIGFYDRVRPVIYLGYYAIIFCLSWILFSLVYYFMTNKNIPLTSSLVAGVVSGTLFQIVQWTYIHFQVYVTSYNAIYGSFAAIPLFLIWLQLSWMITLIGGEISYHFSTTGYLNTSDKQPANEVEIALYLCMVCAENVQKGLFPAQLESIANDLQMPLHPLQSIADKLVQAKLLYAIQNRENEILYQLAKSLSEICLSSVYQAIIAKEIHSWAVQKVPRLLAAKYYFLQYQQGETRTSPNPCLSEIVHTQS